MAKRQSNKMLPDYVARASAPPLQFHNLESNPPQLCRCPSVLIPLTFLPLSCPLPHLFFLLYKKCGLFIPDQRSFCTLYFHLKPERPPPPDLKEEAWDWNLGCGGGSPKLYENTFSHCKVAVWLMFSKHRSLDVRQWGKHYYDEAFLWKPSKLKMNHS